MTALARKLGPFQAGGLTISITAPTAMMALKVSLTEQAGNEHFSIDVTLIEARTLSESGKPQDDGGEPSRPEYDPESAGYGENGERMPYYPARSRQSRFGELAGDPRLRVDALDSFC
jgi:hypothetical protein